MKLANRIISLIESSTFDSIEKIQLPCQERYCFSTQLACSIFGTLYLVGVQISFNHSRREILNLFWLAFTRGQTIKLSFVSRNEEVHQQPRNGLGPFPIGGTKSFVCSYYTVVHWSIMGIQEILIHVSNLNFLTILKHSNFCLHSLRATKYAIFSMIISPVWENFPSVICPGRIQIKIWLHFLHNIDRLSKKNSRPYLWTMCCRTSPVRCIGKYNTFREIY